MKTVHFKPVNMMLAVLLLIVLAGCDANGSDNKNAGKLNPPIFFDCSAVTEIPEIECRALVALYNQTDGANWQDNTGWLANDTPCAWFGVECFGSSNVQRLDLEENLLNGSLPAGLGNLSELRVLSLFDNNLTGVIPPQLGNLSKLTHLKLYSNNLSGSIPVELGNLTVLKELYLSSNRLTGNIPAQLGTLANLTHLALCDNQLDGTIPKRLGELSALIVLHLCRNNLGGNIPDELGNLSALVVMYLNNNNFTGSIPLALTNLSNLAALNLSNNRLEGPIPAALAKLTELRSLELYQNQLTGEILPVFGRLLKLQTLNLGDNQLTGPVPAELGNLGRLEVLSLQKNQLEGNIPAALGNLSKLTALRVSDNRGLKGPLPKGLTNLSLEEFYFNNTAICEPANSGFQAWLNAIALLGRTNVMCQAPTSIILDHNAIREGQAVGTLVGLFGAVDADPGDTFSFEFAAGQGDADNASFSIRNGNELRSSQIFNYNVKRQYSIRVRVTDSAGERFEQVFTVDILMESSTVSCVDFENLTRGTIYTVGDVFSSMGARIQVLDYASMGGTVISGGQAWVDSSGTAGGTGIEIGVNNAALFIDFGRVLSGLRLHFGAFGSNYSITINGSIVDFNAFLNINGKEVAGVTVSVTPGGASGQGILGLSGKIESFAIGGEELWIDDVCPQG
ncbi:MAG: cadherin domain-containing protein [Anaerolineae bacterium]|nr:cadherin domain-containing protein [Anaerolineae bacterium]